MTEPKRYAEVSWKPEDVMARYDVTTERAEEILIEVESHLQSHMTAAGWFFIDELEFELDLDRYKCAWCTEPLTEVHSMDMFITLPGGQKFCSEDCRDAWRRDNDSRGEG